jgi:hypothetical protein
LRDRTVGSPVIERHYLAFGQTKMDIRQEGFDQIVELAEEDLDKVQIEIIFRPIPQPPVTPGRRPPGETRPAPRPWQLRTGRGPAVREARPPSPTHPPGPAAPPAKPEVRAPSSPPKSPSAPAAGGSQASNVAGPPVAVEPASSSSADPSRTTPGAKPTPQG